MTTQQLETLFLLLQQYPCICVPLSTPRTHSVMFSSTSHMISTSKKVAIVGIIDNPTEMIGLLLFGVVR